MDSLIKVVVKYSPEMANMPARLGQDENEPLYIAPSQEYEQNKNIDLIYGNKDGKISLKDNRDFILLRIQCMIVRVISFITLIKLVLIQ